MEVNSDITQLVALATDASESAQMQFAGGIAQIAQALPPPIVTGQLIPFIVSWLPRNNAAVAAAAAGALPELRAAAGGAAPLGELIEALVASERRAVCERVLDAVARMQCDDAEVAQLAKCVARSRFDGVRVFAVRLLDLARGSGAKAEVCLELARDGAFLVRMAVAERIPQLDEADAERVARELMGDLHARIRAYLPVACAQKGFFYGLIAEQLAGDPDWSVRASLANSTMSTRDRARACAVVTKLISDRVWQVKLCALRALTDLLNSKADLEFNDSLSVLSMLSSLIQTKQYPLKIAVIDCFFAISNYCNGEVPLDKLQQFTDHLVLLEKPNIKLHFIELIANSNDKKMLALVKSNIGAVVEALSKDEQWRVRLGVVNNLHKLFEMLPDVSHKNEFYKVCLRLSDDEAFPVRMAAIQYLAIYFVSEGNEIPSFVQEMKVKDSFRKRQIALQIMNEMMKLTEDKAFKEELLSQMKSFMDDECNNVALLAKKLVEEVA